MKYYRAITERYDPATGYTTIKNELLTEKERNKRFCSLSDRAFQVVEVSKKNTFCLFGARFECRA